jgi:ADP-heptose:LPS heptosyltransferase
MDEAFIRKAGFEGINRYTALGHNGIFDLDDQKTSISMNESYEDLFKDLHLDQYITFNRSAAKIPGEDKEQTKIWPREHYQDFISEFKKRFSGIEVVQIGDRETDRFDCADRHYLGEDMELVKYILKHSLFHLDCEGGLVHIATQLGTKCIVLFGPTSSQYFGYEQNINISSEICGDCRGIAADWQVHCYRKQDKLICMRSITAERVLEAATMIMKRSEE